MSLVRRPVFAAVVVLLTNGLARGGETVDLTPHVKAGSLTHVAIQLDAGGHNLVRAEANDKDKDKNTKDKADEQKLPSSVAAKLEFDEMRISDEAAPENGTPLAIRYYDTAEATIKVENTGRAPKLPDECRLIALEQSEQRPVLYCPDTPLNREQLDLIDVVGDPLTADRLLPGKAVAEGDAWPNDASVMGPLLTLDTVAVCEVQSILDSCNDSYAKIRLAGIVHGMSDGAAVEQDVRGVYLFDRKLHRVTRLNLAIREARSIGGATPGLDAVAKLQIAITPIEKSEHLGDDAVAKFKTQARARAHDLSYESPTLGFRVSLDRQWYVTAEAREAVTLRRVDKGDLAAQCTITHLPSKSAGRQTSLEQFQKDITYSLGKSFGELVSSKQWQNAAGLYCFEVVVRGLVEEVPVEWHYFLVAPESGPRVSVAVTIEQPMLERVATADRELVESLQLFPATPAAQTASQPSGQILK